MKIVPRLNKDAETEEEIKEYYSIRAMQAYLSDFIWSGKVEIQPGGIFKTSFLKNDIEYFSFYFPPAMRGRGLGHMLGKYLHVQDIPVMTHPDCNIHRWLDKYHINYTILTNTSTSQVYRLVEEEFKHTYARRSGVHYMYHVDEGLMILKSLGASQGAMDAYCLHLVLQTDEAVKTNLRRICELGCDSEVIALAMEYRHIANKWLPNQVQGGWYTTRPKLSPLKDVNEMLIADKIQNYKDFILYHKRSHPRSVDLDLYFSVWLEVLGVSRDCFKETIDVILDIQGKEKYYEIQ